MATTKTTKKPAWRTVRCVVEYRTNDPQFSKRDLSRHVQDVIDDSGFRLTDSKLWTKGFNKVIARMTAARPKKLQAAVKALDKTVDRLKKL